MKVYKQSIITLEVSRHLGVLRKMGGLGKVGGGKNQTKRGLTGDSLVTFLHLWLKVGGGAKAKGGIL